MLVCKVEYSKCACLSVKKTISVWFFFFNWLRFLIDFRFADFRIIRISALPVFHISSFSRLRFLKRLFYINLCLTLKIRLNGRFSEVVVLKSQFSDPKRKLLGWYSDSWANFHLWTVVLPSYSTRNVTQFHLFWASDFVSMAFKYGRIPAVSNYWNFMESGISGIRKGLDLWVSTSNELGKPYFWQNLLEIDPLR